MAAIAVAACMTLSVGQFPRSAADTAKSAASLVRTLNDLASLKGAILPFYHGAENLGHASLTIVPDCEPSDLSCETLPRWRIRRRHSVVGQTLNPRLVMHSRALVWIHQSYRRRTRQTV